MTIPQVQRRRLRVNEIEILPSKESRIEWHNPSYGIMWCPSGIVAEIFLVGMPDENDEKKVEYYLLSRFLEDGNLVTLKRKGTYNEYSAGRIVKRFIIMKSKRGTGE